MNSLFSSLRLVVATLAVCCVAYPAVMLAFGQWVVPDNANGRLLRASDGTIIGSRQIAQAFTSPQYFWPRPSAVNHNGAGAGGSNKSPTNPELTQRARELIARHGATADRPLPADLTTTSGGGLDPHISEAAARFQVERVASVRGMTAEAVQAIVDGRAFAPGGPLAPERIVNVLELNLALDQPSSSP